MLFFALAALVAWRVLFHDEKGGALRCAGENGDEIRVAPGRDELLGAVDAVAGDLARTVGHGVGLGLEGGDVAARVGLGHRVGHERLAGGDLAEPLLFLLLGGADHDGVGPELDGEEGGGDPQADFGHLPRHHAAVPRPAAQAAVNLRDHQQLQADLGAQHFPDDLLRKDLLAVELENFFLGQQPFFQLGHRVQNHLLRLGVQPGQRPVGGSALGIHV